MVVANIELFYDKECPFCNSFANYLVLKETHTLKLFNAREARKEIEAFKVKGFDINDGFIIRIDKTKLYQGSEAILFLNKVAQKKVWFYDNWLFKSIVYPFVKALRKLILFIKRKKIHI